MKALERKAQIERRTAERVVHRNEGHACALSPFCIVRSRGSRGSAVGSTAFGFGAGTIVDERTLNSKRVIVGFFHLPLGQNAIRVVGLNPFAQEPRRHRQPHRFLVHGFELHADEPARKDVLAKFETQSVLDAVPAILIDVHDGVLLLWNHGSTQRMWRGQNSHPAALRGTQHTLKFEI